MAIIRFLKILSYIIWLLTTLIGTVMFYNLAGLQWEPQATTHPDRIEVNVEIYYRGFFFELNFTIEVRLYDANNNLLGRSRGTKLLQPGETASIKLVIENLNTTKIRNGYVDVWVYQQKWGIELIGMDFTYEIGG